MHIYFIARFVTCNINVNTNHSESNSWKYKYTIVLLCAYATRGPVLSSPRLPDIIPKNFYF